METIIFMSTVVVLVMANAIKLYSIGANKAAMFMSFLAGIGVGMIIGLL